MDELKVVLIGGPPGAGKTTLARALAAKLGFGWTSGDDLASAGRAVTDAETNPGLHRVGGGPAYFTERTLAALIDDAMAQEEAVWPAVERVIEMHRSVRPPIVIDWWLLPPDRVTGIGREGIASLWLTVDPDVLEARERRNDFWDGSTDPERMLANFMGRSLWRNELVETRTEALGLPVHRQIQGTTPEDVRMWGLGALAG